MYQHFPHRICALSIVINQDGGEDEDGGDDDEQAMEQKCLDSEAKDYDELMPRMALNLKNQIKYIN